MSYWKSKVVPKLKKIFEKGSKKKGASEACKLFDSSKETLDKEIEEKKGDLHPKVIEIYRSTTTIISKKLLKEPSESAVKGNPDVTQSILQDLAKAGFPGAQSLSDAGGKYGAALLPGPIVYLFQKTSTFLVEEALPEPKQETREIAIEETVAVEEKAKEPEATPEGEVINPAQPPPVETVEEKKDAIGVEIKKEESVPAAVEAKKEEVASIEVKQAEVVVVEAPIEAKKEVTPNPIEAKNEEAATSKEGKKEDVAPAKEAKKEELKEDVAPAKEVKKEEVKPITIVEEKKEEVKSVSVVEEKQEEAKPVAIVEDKKETAP